jgi:hypothetical protein
MSLGVLQFGQYIVACRTVRDVVMFVVGDMKANELLLAQVLESFERAGELVFKSFGVNEVMEKMENVYLILDEMIDQGYIFENNPEIIAARTLLKEDSAFHGKISTPSLF